MRSLMGKRFAQLHHTSKVVVKGRAGYARCLDYFLDGGIETVLVAKFVEGSSDDCCTRFCAPLLADHGPPVSRAAPACDHASHL